MGKAILERIPHVSNTPRLCSRHSEAVLEGREISAAVSKHSESDSARLDNGIHNLTSEKADTYNT